MSDAEKAIAEAKEAGKAEALASVGATMAEARFRSAAAGKVTDVDAVTALAGDMRRFVKEDGTVDDDAIKSAVEGFAKLAPPRGEHRDAGVVASLRQGAGQPAVTADGNAWMRGAVGHK